MTETLVLTLGLAVTALILRWIVRDAQRRLTGRVRRDRTHFNTVFPRRR